MLDHLCHYFRGLLARELTSSEFDVERRGLMRRSCGRRARSSAPRGADLRRGGGGGHAAAVRPAAVGRQP